MTRQEDAEVREAAPAHAQKRSFISKQWLQNVSLFFLNEAIAFQSSRIVLTFPLLTENYLEIIAAGQHRIGGRKKINSTCLSHKTKITCLYLRRSATALFTVNTYSAIRRRENSPLMVIIAYIYRPPAPTGK